jgi:hypothetical protein
MAFTTIAYASTAAGINAALTALPSIPDQSLRQNVNGYIVPNLSRVPFMYARGASMTRAQLSSVTLQQLAKHEIRPIANAQPTGNQVPTGVPLYGDPLQLSPFEELDVNITNTASDAEFVLVWLSDGPLLPAPFFGAAAGQAVQAPAPGPGGSPQLLTGQGFSVKASSAVTTVAAAWTLCTLTMDQNLPPGHYQILGLRYEGATAECGRMVIPGYAWRPGGIGLFNPLVNDWDRQRYGGWGVWGEFDSIQLPAIEVLTSGADTSQIFTLDLVRTGPVGAMPPGQVH